MLVHALKKEVEKIKNADNTKTSIKKSEDCEENKNKTQENQASNPLLSGPKLEKEISGKDKKKAGR